MWRFLPTSNLLSLWAICSWLDSGLFVVTNLTPSWNIGDCSICTPTNWFHFNVSKRQPADRGTYNPPWVKWFRTLSECVIMHPCHLQLGPPSDPTCAVVLAGRGSYPDGKRNEVKNGSHLHLRYFLLEWIPLCTRPLGAYLLLPPQGFPPPFLSSVFCLHTLWICNVNTDKYKDIYLVYILNSYCRVLSWNWNSGAKFAYVP